VLLLNQMAGVLSRASAKRKRGGARPGAGRKKTTGWARCRNDVSDEQLPVSPPRTQLLSFDWQLFGLIDPFEVPGPLAAA
jgi:hypothetical protein